MKNMTKLMFAVMCVIVPAVAGAQTPVPPAPPAVPAAPKPAPAPMAMPAIVIPELAYALDAQDYKLHVLEAQRDALHAAQAQMLTSEKMLAISEATRQATSEATRQAVENARIAAQDVRWEKFDSSFPMLYGQQFAQTYSSDSERSFYDRGQSALQSKQYEQAILRFDQAIATKGTRTDGAMYWKAFAQYKLGRSADATATLNELSRQFKNTNYAKDVKALEAEVKRSAGQPVRPENEDDEDLKLLAIQSLQNSDPERAIPLLEGVLNSAGSIRLKDRALFVLATSSQATAHTMLVNIAKGGNPDLQIRAIRYLGQTNRSGKNPTTAAELGEIFKSTENEDVKLAVLRSFGSAGDRAQIVSLMGTTTTDAIRREGINQLGSAQAGPELWSMYQQSGTSKELRMQILSALANMGAYDKVVEVAKTEKDADIRRRAIRSLGNMRADRSGAALSEIYSSLTDLDDKKAVISGLANQNNAEGMIAIYRKESNFEIKKRIVESLGNMPKNEAAKAFLVEILK